MHNGITISREVWKRVVIHYFGKITLKSCSPSPCVDAMIVSSKSFAIYQQGIQICGGVSTFCIEAKYLQ